MMDLEPVDADQLAKQYAGVVKSMARAIVRHSPVVSIEDLEQEGMAALVLAADTYNASAGSLSAYVRACIRNALIAEANRHCGAFVIDPRVRLQVNKLVRLRNRGESDEAIMRELGLSSRSQYTSLLSLVDIEYYDAELETETDDGCNFYAAGDVIRALEEVGLTDSEITFVKMLIENQSRRKVQEVLNIDDRKYSQLKITIANKIRDWGRE